MQVDTNELVDINKLAIENNLSYDDMRDKLANEGFEAVPDDLADASIKKLNGESKIMVSKTSGGKLSKWCASRRKEKRKIKLGTTETNRRRAKRRSKGM